MNNPNPECREVAFYDEEKFITCRFDSSVEADISDCLDAPVSAALMTGASVEWCLFSDNMPICYNSTDLPTSGNAPPTVNISDRGVLHIISVSPDMKLNPGSPDDHNVVNCSFANSQGQVCEPPILLNLLFFALGI